VASSVARSARGRFGGGGLPLSAPSGAEGRIARTAHVVRLRLSVTELLDRNGRVSCSLFKDRTRIGVS